MNIRLVRVFQFLCQFRLFVRHKPEKKYIIPDTLSRLASVNDASHNTSYLELDALFIYHITLIEINPDLVARILKGYASNN